MTEKTRRIAAISMLLLAGILAGTQLGKIAPLVGWYRDDAGMSLVAIGWLTALLGLFVALAALPASFAIVRSGRLRPRRCFCSLAASASRFSNIRRWFWRLA